MELKDYLHQYSEWLDGNKVMATPAQTDLRSHDDFVAEFVRQLPDYVDHFGGPMRTPMGYTCAVHKHDEWVPTNWHHIWPLGLGGPDEPGNKVQVCANGHYATHEFLRQLILHDGEVPYKIRTHFGPKVRDLAERGWIAAGRPVHGSGGE